MTLLAECLCGSTSSTVGNINGIDVLSCADCGIIRQDVPMDLAAYARFYEVDYLKRVYTHSYEHDRAVAEMRLDAYQFAVRSRVLDVGAANGAFVHAARARGFDAWGQDLARDAGAECVYVGDLPDVHFPPEYFDVVTLHDVLEHVPDPQRILCEIRRILKPDGRLIVDFPRFHDPPGRHHWKVTEHIWILTDDQLIATLTKAGFNHVALKHPIPSKTVVHATPASALRGVNVLVPPGIGDGYWVFVKLRGFLEERGYDLADLWVHDAGPRRSHEFWQRVPFVRFRGYAKFDEPRVLPRQQRRQQFAQNPEGRLADQAYRMPGHSVQEIETPFKGFLLSANGDLDAGRSLDSSISGRTNWHEPIFQPKSELQLAATFRAKFAPYVVCTFWDQGFYQKWLGDFGEPKIIETLRRLADSGLRVIIAGAGWDQGRIASRLSAADDRFIDLIGETDFEQLLALLRGAAAVFGFPAGSSLLGPYLGRPTVLLWNGHFPKSMWTNCVAPGDAYQAVPTNRATPASLAEIVKLKVAHGSA